ncbi:glycosyltransferase family 2 protein [bacterium]|nr:glycosyltransferase family 2 protein [bacterium]
MTPYSITVVTPVYNEETLLEESIALIDTFLSRHFTDYEILIIESGSTDRSGEICDRLSGRYDRITVIHEGSRNGFGSALKLGFNNAAKDIVCVITADMPFPLDTIVRALPLLEQNDCVLSYRSKDNRRSYFRKIQSFVFNALIKLIFRLRMKHSSSAFKIFRRTTLQKMTFISNGWFVDIEILYWITENKVKYIEIPVELIERQSGESTITLFTPFLIIKEMFKFYKNKILFHNH